MAIVNMRKLNIVAMSYDKDALLNALHRTNAAEITLHAETDNTVVPEADVEGLKTRISSIEAALAALCSAVENREKELGQKSGVLKDGFDVTYSEFMSAKDSKEDVEAAVEKINALTDEKNILTAELAKIKRQKSAAEIYAPLTTPFEAFCDTAHTRARLGLVPVQSREALENALTETELCAYEVLNTNGEYALLFVTAHKTATGEVDGTLSAYGFSECPHKGKQTGADICADLQKKEKETLARLQANEEGMYALSDVIRPIKMYCDYLSFVMEKEQTSDKLRATERTVLMQAYVPAEAEETVKEAIVGLHSAIWFEFSDPTEEDTPPTLMKNNAIVSCFESITNTYSAPNYREFDPNAVMAFFYSLFMGFIIGDMGYGILMSLVGGWLWWKNRARPTGMSRLAGAFAVGGIFAILWGALFNSCFGFMIFGQGNTVMPDPKDGRWSLAGIQVPSVLIVCMEIGVVQLSVGYFCKAVQEWRRGNVMDGICDGVLWTLFSVGVGLAIVGFVEEANMSALALIGGCIAGGSLLLAMLTAGRHEKSFKKITKGFGAAYGIINYASDILSYARLYGLMLSGAVIASIIAQYCGQFIASGNIALIILAVVLLVVGHGFNLVMNLLGAYIHDARLQYVEFYGRFFEGEGELFAPLGSNRKYVYLLPAENAAAGDVAANRA